jgi:hypothetical protein
LDVVAIIKSTYASTVTCLTKQIRGWLSDSRRPRIKIVEDVVNALYLLEQFVFLPDIVRDFLFPEFFPVTRNALCLLEQFVFLPDIVRDFLLPEFFPLF